MIGQCPDYMYRVADTLDDPGRFEGRCLYMIYGDDDYDRCTEYVTDFNACLQSKEVSGFYSELVMVKGGGHVPAGSVARGIEYVFSLPR